MNFPKFGELEDEIQSSNSIFKFGENSPQKTLQKITSKTKILQEIESSPNKIAPTLVVQNFTPSNFGMIFQLHSGKLT